MAILILFVVAAVGFLIASSVGQNASSGSSQASGGTGSAPAPPAQDNVPPTTNVSTTVSTTKQITNDPSTWPSGDAIWNICHAIALAEGANISGSVPDRYNNPGDISDGASQYSQTFISGSYVTMFPNKATGWQWLYNKVYNAATGRSTVYQPTMDWYDISTLWVCGGTPCPNGNNWAENVASNLGVDPTTTLAAYTGW